MYSSKVNASLKAHYFHLLAAYIVLLKPSVMYLAVFTAATGLFLAPAHVSLSCAFLAIICIALGGGSAGALNMWYEADIDALMRRTRQRPIPAKKIAPLHALLFGLGLAVISVLGLGYFTNSLAAFLLGFTIFFYAVVYTIFLKRYTPQNIVIGGIAGALPPMVGWAAATGQVSWASFFLFLIIFLWTPGHFWSLCLFTVGDYAAANIPMLPNVKGVAVTKKQILFYTILTAFSGVLPFWFFPFLGPVYAVIATLLGGGFVYYAWRLLRAKEGEETIFWAKKTFFFSLTYLFILFGVLFLFGIAQYIIKLC